MDSCEQARKMCLIAKRAKEMINVSGGFPPHLLCSPCMEQLLSASPQHPRFTRCSLPLHSAAQFASARSKAVNQIARFKQGTKPSQGNSHSLAGAERKGKFPSTVLLMKLTPLCRSGDPSSQGDPQPSPKAADQCSG